MLWILMSIILLLLYIDVNLMWKYLLENGSVIFQFQTKYIEVIV